MSDINHEIKRRRTFAIISHPDAGKTTLTEKLLLYGGALELAGSVTAKKKQRDTSSDWMELEKKRGISISSTLLQFEYRGFRMNLLDTPGHRDFSEDTYRVLMAVDAVIMVIDAGKGIESQTRKLFEICRRRGIPIFTFINKLDRPAMQPLELIDQLEKVLNIHAFPVNWPLESGPFFKGVYDRLQKKVHMYEKVPGGAYRAPVSIRGIDDPLVKEVLPPRSYEQIVEEIEMLDIAQGGFDDKAVLAGETTPVFFGSAANNFGIELMLEGFLNHSRGPAPRQSGGLEVPLEGPVFSGFVFKIQTNMNRQHRDRMVFVRICSGRFTRDMTAVNKRTGKEVRLSSSHSMFGRDRETLDEAFAGDILGFITNADFRIGDTVTTDHSVSFSEIPRFAPECFAYIQNTTVSNYKSFRKGLDHLLAEDIVQAFNLESHVSTVPLLGAVGPLQFEVMQYRLSDEYNVESRLDTKQWELLRWLPFGESAAEYRDRLPMNCAFGTDDRGRSVLLFPNEWTMNFFREKNPETVLLDSPDAG